MPEERPYSSISYEGIEVVPHDAPEPYVEQPGLEAMPSHNPDNSEKQAVDPSSPSIAKDPAWRESPIGLKRSRWGHSRRFWILVAVAVLVVIAVVVGAATGATVGKHHKSTEQAVQNDPFPTSPAISTTSGTGSTSTVGSTATSTATTTPGKVVLNCPSIDELPYESVARNSTNTTQGLSFTYKQLCNTTVMVGPNTIVFISIDPESSASSSNPSTVTSFEECMDLCSTWNISPAQSETSALNCFASWLDANKTSNNCYRFTLESGNLTKADISEPGEPLTALAVLIFWDDGENLADDQFLSNNGDWDL